MRVPRLPVADRQDLAERHLRLERRFRLDEVPSVRDAVHVHVHADGRQVEAHGHGEVRGLASHARQLAQLLHRVRQHAAEAFAQDLRQVVQVAGLVVVEADGEDEFFELGHGNIKKFM